MENSTYQPSLKSQVSHELRTPITGIMGMLEELNTTFLTSQQQEYLSIIRAATEKLLSLENKLQLLTAHTEVSTPILSEKINEFPNNPKYKINCVSNKPLSVGYG